MPRKFGRAAKNARECPSGPMSSATALTPSTSAMAIFTSRRKKHFEKNYDPRLVQRRRACAISRIVHCANCIFQGFLATALILGFLKNQEKVISIVVRRIESWLL